MIDFKNVSISFKNQPILQNINLHINQGEFVSLVGESGIGKTTLLRLIYMDLFPDSGIVSVGKFNSLTIQKKEIPLLRRTLGIVFQDFKLLEDRNIFENVAFALQVTNVKRKDIQKRVLRVLADVGLSHKRSNMPDELSGGEQQRVVIARALVNEPLALLADEPTGNLDPNTSFEILDLLKDINRKGTAIVLATHNYELVRRSESRILQIKDANITELESI
ncbi:MAG: Cell division transporter, ATP-binding protein FtsE [Ignavibacteriae bacterium]|nr:MAG: Cell division transporter, ATP-binding protein FtsE [Ignavibacteriota bacterium]